MTKKHHEEEEAPKQLSLESGDHDKVSLGPYINWALRHVRDIGTLSSELSAIQQADSLDTRWAATKQLGDTLVPLLDDFPDVTPPAPTPGPGPTPTPTPVGPAPTDSVELFHRRRRRLETLLARSDVQAELMAFNFDGHILAMILQNLPAIIAFIQQMMQFMHPTA